MKYISLLLILLFLALPVKADIKAVCQNFKQFPKSFIYKTVGSTHFSDCRRRTQGIIVKPGVRRSWPRKISVLAKNGKVVSVLGRYASGERDWSARYYACIGAGRKYRLSGRQVAKRARKLTGSNRVYFKLGRTCFGPIPAQKCVGSSQC